MGIKPMAQSVLRTCDNQLHQPRLLWLIYHLLVTHLHKNERKINKQKIERGEGVPPYKESHEENTHKWIVCSRHKTRKSSEIV
jgi:hypothetical protein